MERDGRGKYHECHEHYRDGFSLHLAEFDFKINRPRALSGRDTDSDTVVDEARECRDVIGSYDEPGGTVCQIYLTSRRPSALPELVNLIPSRRIHEIWSSVDLFIAP